MITIVIETFENSHRVFKKMDLKQTVGGLFPEALSIGIDTGVLDRDGTMIATNHHVKFKGNLCRLTLHNGQIKIRHPFFGLCSLEKYFADCQVIR